MFWKWGRQKSDPVQRLETLEIDCSHCGQVHRGIFDLGAKYPDHYFTVPMDERAQRAKVSPDLCAIDSEHFFARCVLEIPIVGTAEVFAFGVWGALSKENFETYVEHFAKTSLPDYGPFLCWLDTYPEGYSKPKEGLKAQMVFRADGQRPLLVLDPSDHLLCLEQNEGITVDRLLEIYAQHGHV